LDRSTTLELPILRCLVAPLWATIRIGPEVSGASSAGLQKRTIKSIADLESAGTIESAARGLLQILTSPSDVIGGYKSAFSADYDPDRLSAAEQRLRTRHR
jgi:hypothetical protein